MDVDELLDEYADKADWSLKQRLEKCLLYIGRQKDNDSFEEFLVEESKRAGDDEESEADERAGEFG